MNVKSLVYVLTVMFLIGCGGQPEPKIDRDRIDRDADDAHQGLNR